MAKISVWAKPPKKRRSSQVLGHLRLEHGLEHSWSTPPATRPARRALCPPPGPPQPVAEQAVADQCDPAQARWAGCGG